MSLVPVLDLRPTPSDKVQSIVSNVGAEQALLGSLLYDAQVGFPLLPGALGAEHFYEPFHQRLFARMDRAFKKGVGCDLFVLAEQFSRDPAFEELGGVRYLADLVDSAPPAANAPDYARVVLDVATRRQLLSIADELRKCVLKSQESGEELLTEAMTAMARIQTSGSDLQLTGAAEAVDQVMDYIDNPGGHASGLLTGLQPLDEHLGPWLPGDLIAGAGRPGMGKSATAGVIATNVAIAGGGVVEINAEMSVGQMWRRRMSAMAFQMYADQAPSYSKIRKRTIEFAERNMLAAAGEKLRSLPIKGIKRSGITLSRMRALILRQKAEFERQGIPLELVTVDHGGIIKPDSDYRSRVDEQTAISGGLKEMADDLQVAIYVLLQLNRKVEDRDDKRPQLQDLRDSGSWEQDADVVIGWFRAAYYAQREKAPDESSAKGRADWADWDQRKRSPWIDALFLKVREGEPGAERVWANMRTNTILGHAPADDHGGFI